MLNTINTYKPTELEKFLFNDLKEAIEDRFKLPEELNEDTFETVTTLRSARIARHHKRRLIEIKVNQRVKTYSYVKRREEQVFHEAFIENIKNYTFFPFSSKTHAFLARRRKPVVQHVKRQHKYQPVVTQLINIRFTVHLTRSHS